MKAENFTKLCFKDKLVLARKKGIPLAVIKYPTFELYLISVEGLFIEALFNRLLGRVISMYAITTDEVVKYLSKIELSL